MVNRTNKPTEADALDIAAQFWGRPARDARRFETGLGHWVYDVHGHAGDNIVVRVGAAAQQEDFDGAVHWSTTLRALGVPLPALLDYGQCNGLPYTVLERLPGDDLGAKYPSLSTAQKRAVAAEVRRVQGLVGRLPEAPGYGYARLPEGPYLPCWADVVDQSIARSRARIEAAGLVDPRNVQVVEQHALRLASYFSTVRPVPFLDDTTTKNVLVKAGVFTGIVDVDWVCFGDPLLTIALTRTGLLSLGFDLIYTDHWCELLEPTAEQRAVVHFYTALFCLDFLSELGQSFNRPAEAPSLIFVSRIEGLLNDNLERAHVGR